MYRDPRGKTLEPIKEENEEEEEANNVITGITSICTSDKLWLSPTEVEHEMFLGEDKQYHVNRTLPQNIHVQDGADDVLLPHLKQKCGVEDLEHITERSELLECIIYYKMQSDELQEFTSNEKKVREEFFSDQLSEGNKKICELENKNEYLKDELNKANDKCEDLLSTLTLLRQSYASDGNSKKSEGPEKVLLSEAKQKTCEFGNKTDHLEDELNKSKDKCKSLISALISLQQSKTTDGDSKKSECPGEKLEARSVLSNIKEVNACHLCNGHTNDITRCEEKSESGFCNMITELKQEICNLREENARHAALSKKMQDFHELMKSQVHECKLIAKISDLERELDTLKQQNLKLSEDLNKRIVELRETEATQSLLKGRIRIMENEKVKVSETLERSFEEVQNLNSELSNLKKENDMLQNKNATALRSLEEKNEELGKQSSEVSRLKKENFALNVEFSDLSKSMDDTVMKIKELDLKYSKFEEEMCSMMNGNLNHSDILEEQILEIKQFSLRTNDGNSVQLYENDAQGLKLKNDIPSLECTAPNKKIALPADRKLNCLRRKVTLQRRILNATRKRESKMKTDVELCKKRIIQLELQAHNEHYMNRSYTYYLESLVSSLKNENMILRTHQGCVQMQMKTAVSPSRVTKKCSQLKQRHMAVQTSISPSDFCQTMVSNSDVTQDCGLPKVHVKTHNMEKQNLPSLHPSKHHGKPNISYVPSDAQIQSKRIRELQIKSNFIAFNFV